MNVKGLTTTLLATGLAEAVRKDELLDADGFDLSAGVFGTHVSNWLRGMAEDFVAVQKPSEKVFTLKMQTAMIERAATNANIVFHDSCNHTHQAIDYMRALLHADSETENK